MRPRLHGNPFDSQCLHVPLLCSVWRVNWRGGIQCVPADFLTLLSFSWAIFFAQTWILEGNIIICIWVKLETKKLVNLLPGKTSHTESLMKSVVSLSHKKGVQNSFVLIFSISCYKAVFPGAVCLNGMLLLGRGNTEHPEVRPHYPASSQRRKKPIANKKELLCQSHKMKTAPG